MATLPCLKDKPQTCINPGRRCRWFDTQTCSCLLEDKKADYRDAAEFEARVAKKMATVICGECEEFNKKPNCPISIYQAHGLYECRMKHARLSVEAEMIREGKGSGSPEVK